MLCQNCNENEANIKYTQIINGEKKEMILCEECSKKLGIDTISFDMPIEFSNFFMGFGDSFSEYDNAMIPNIALPKVTKCETCGLTYDEFISKGKFGCSNCYKAFGSRIEPILKSLHGETTYNGRKGKVTVNVTGNNIHKQSKEKTYQEDESQEKIQILKTKLKTLIKEERYEEAAKVRDEIRELEG